MSDSETTGLKVIVITGVSRGLGRAMAQEFSRLGHTVCGCARPSLQLDHLQRELGTNHLLMAADVGSDREMQQFADKVRETYGPPDLLINNAAVINQNQKLWEISAAEFEHSFSVNVSGTANAIRHFVPMMIERGKGVIVNFSSGWGRSVSAEVAPYCATKWAIEGLTKALAQELPRGFCAVPLNPGIINTEMLQSCFGQGAESFPQPGQWAEKAVPFLLSLDERHNGESLTVP